MTRRHLGLFHSARLAHPTKIVKIAAHPKRSALRRTLGHWLRETRRPGQLTVTCMAASRARNLAIAKHFNYLLWQSRIAN